MLQLICYARKGICGLEVTWLHRFYLLVFSLQSLSSFWINMKVSYKSRIKLAFSFVSDSPLPLCKHCVEQHKTTGLQMKTKEQEEERGIEQSCGGVDTILMIMQAIPWLIFTPNARPRHCVGASPSGSFPFLPAKERLSVQALSIR